MKQLYKHLLLTMCVSGVVMAQVPEVDMVAHDMDMAKEVFVGRGMVAGQAMNVPVDFPRGPSTMTFVSAGPTLGRLFPPEVIMHNREKLNLTARQVNTIKDEMKTFQSGIVDIQWDLNEAQSNLDKELNNDKIDDKRALSLVDDVMRAENALKKSNLALLIKIRNVLDENQIAELEKSSRFGMGHFNMAVPAGPPSIMRWQHMQ